MTKQITAIIEHGQVRLPEALHLPDGSVVQVVWSEDDDLPPLEREPWTEEELQADLAWANGRRFAP